MQSGDSSDRMGDASDILKIPFNNGEKNQKEKFRPSTDTAELSEPSHKHRRLGGPQISHGGELDKGKDALGPSPPVTLSSAHFPNVFAGTTNEVNECDFCGSTGSCGRITTFDDTHFSVFVEGSSADTYLVAACIAPDPFSVDCVYAPNNEEPTFFPSYVNLWGTDGYLGTCLQDNECCSVIYSRERPEPITFGFVDGECNTATCRFVERVCKKDGTVEFQCPIGSNMLIGEWPSSFVYVW